MYSGGNSVVTIYVTYMKMFRIDHRIRKSLTELRSSKIGAKTLISGKIQNGRHEIIKFILSSSIIGICFRYQGMQKTNDTFIRHHYHAKLKIAAMKSLMLACVRQ